VAARYKKAEGRAVHWIALSQAMVMGVGIADELRRQRVEAGLKLSGVQSLVQGASPGAAGASPGHYTTGPTRPIAALTFRGKEWLGPMGPSLCCAGSHCIEVGGAVAVAGSLHEARSACRACPETTTGFFLA